VFSFFPVRGSIFGRVGIWIFHGLTEPTCLVLELTIRTNETYVVETEDGTPILERGA